MVVGQLRQILDRLPDSAVVLVSSSDHSYRSPMVGAGTAWREGPGEWTEDFSDDGEWSKEYPGVQVQALIIE